MPNVGLIGPSQRTDIGVQTVGFPILFEKTSQQDMPAHIPHNRWYDPKVQCPEH